MRSRMRLAYQLKRPRLNIQHILSNVETRPFYLIIELFKVVPLVSQKAFPHLLKAKISSSNH